MIKNERKGEKRKRYKLKARNRYIEDLEDD